MVIKKGVFNESSLDERTKAIEKTILAVLKKEKRLPTTKLCHAVFHNTNTYIIKGYLESMERRKLIKKEEETQGTYWSVKK